MWTYTKFDPAAANSRAVLVPEKHDLLTLMIAGLWYCSTLTLAPEQSVAGAKRHPSITSLSIAPF
jgi:hypothetical protein